MERIEVCIFWGVIFLAFLIISIILLAGKGEKLIFADYEQIIKDQGSKVVKRVCRYFGVFILSIDVYFAIFVIASIYMIKWLLIVDAIAFAIGIIWFLIAMVRVRKLKP